MNRTKEQIKWAEKDTERHTSKHNNTSVPVKRAIPKYKVGTHYMARSSMKETDVRNMIINNPRRFADRKDLTKQEKLTIILLR